MQFTIHLQPSGHQMQAKGDESLLDAALRQGIGLPYSCRSGLCGTCLCHLESGSVHYPKGRSPLLDTAGPDALLACQAQPRSDLRIRAVEIATSRDIKPRTMPVKVAGLRQLNHDVVQMRLSLPDGQRLQFLAGQYLEILLPNGHRRAFSIANAPHQDEQIELHIRHVTGGEFTDMVFSQLKEKAILRIQAPLGNFVLREDSHRARIMVAGGTGFGPVKGIIEHSLHLGQTYPIHLYWGVRSRRDLYMAELAESWVRTQPHIHYTPVLSEPDPDWMGRHGFVHQAVLADHPSLAEFDVYMAGPPVMVKAARDGFAVAGLPLERLYSDAFEYGAAQDGQGAAK
jgi:CDP-4-dehydro-6-deoxyglucose reductase